MGQGKSIHSKIRCVKIALQFWHMYSAICATLAHRCVILTHLVCVEIVSVLKSPNCYQKQHIGVLI